MPPRTRCEAASLGSVAHSTRSKSLTIGWLRPTRSSTRTTKRSRRSVKISARRPASRTSCDRSSGTNTTGTINNRLHGTLYTERKTNATLQAKLGKKDKAKKN
ncbi:hypothetical protein CF326_g8149 [Tilletia indica]|nr:hypothetical protein CF326_g8149 [Tilletia indica]